MRRLREGNSKGITLEKKRKWNAGREKENCGEKDLAVGFSSST